MFEREQNFLIVIVGLSAKAVAATSAATAGATAVAATAGATAAAAERKLFLGHTSKIGFADLVLKDK